VAVNGSVVTLLPYADWMVRAEVPPKIATLDPDRSGSVVGEAVGAEVAAACDPAASTVFGANGATPIPGMSTDSSRDETNTAQSALPRAGTRSNRM